MTTKLTQNQLPNEPALKDLLDLTRREIFLNLNCHHVGTVQSFDPIKQLAKATINYKKTYFLPNAAGVYEPITKDYPVIVDAPVIVLGGGTGVLTFPITKGDECLILFNDRDIDNWLTGSSNSPVKTGRLHSYTDAILLVGLRSLANVVTTYNSTEPEFRTKDGVGKFFLKSGSTGMSRGTTEVSVDASKVTVKNATLALGTLMQNLITQLEALNTQLQTVFVAGVLGTAGPISGGAATAVNAAGVQIGLINTQIASIKTNFQGLLA